MASEYARIVGLTGTIFLLGAAQTGGQTEPTQPSSPDAEPTAKTRTRLASASSRESLSANSGTALTRLAVFLDTSVSVWARAS